MFPSPSVHKGSSRRSLLIGLLLLVALSGFSQNLEIQVPLVFRQQVFGEISIEINPENGNLLRISESLIPLLKNRIDFPDIETLDGFLDIALLEEAGIEGTLDQSTLSLVLTVSGDREKPVVYTLGQSSRRPGGEILPGAFLSGFLNQSLVVEHQFYQEGEEWTHKFPVYWDLEPSLTLQGDWNLGGRLAFDFSQENIFDLERLTLRKGFPEILAQLDFGTTETFGLSRLQVPAFWGGSFASNFGLQPELETSPLGGYILTLTEQSDIQIYQNGQYVDKVTLPPGPVEIQDFPLKNGVNRIQLLVEGVSGKSDLYQFELPYNSLALKPGIIEYWISGGVPTTALENPMASLGLRLGLSSFFTLGTAILGDPDEILAVQEGLIQTPIGLFRLDYSLLAIGSDWTAPVFAPAAGFQYDFLLAHNPQFLRGSLNLRWQGENFRNPSAGLLTTSVPSLNAGVNLAQPLWSGLLTSVIYNIQVDLSDMSRTQKVTGSLSWMPVSGHSLIVRGGVNIDSQGEITSELGLVYNFFPSSVPVFSSLGHQVDLGQTRAQISYSQSVEETNEIQVSTLVEAETNQPQRFTLGGRFQNGYFETGLSHGLSFDENGEITGRTSFRGASALAFAGDAFSLGRPIRSGFLIVRTLPEYRDFRPSIRNTGGGAATTDFFDSGILSGLREYESHNVSADSEVLPYGYSLGSSFYTFSPSYLQGGVVELGSPKRFFLNARLVSPDGEPVSLVAGTLVDLEDDSRQMFFTNRVGETVFNGLAEGLYRIELLDGRELGFFFDENFGNSETTIDILVE